MSTAMRHGQGHLGVGERETAKPGEGPVETVRHTSVIARRNLMKIGGDPSLLLDATLMPMLFTLVFVYVFGGAIAGTQADYTQFLIPGIMALNITIVSRTTGIGIAVDFSNGTVDRFRSLPIARLSVLSGQIVADTVRMLMSILVIMVFAFIIGFRVETGFSHVVAAILLLMAFGIALAWVSAFIGLILRSVQSVATISTLWMIPLQFGSSLFVPTATMPDWLQVFVRFNPMTLVVDTVRTLLTGGAVGASLWGALAWLFGIIAVFVPLSVRQYSRRR